MKITSGARKIGVAAFSLLLMVGCARQEAPVVLPLSEEAIQEALDYGRKNADLSFDEFTQDWTVDLGYEQGKGKVVLMTPFLRVALMGKQSAVLDKEPNRKLLTMVLKENLNLLHFRFCLYGDEPDFGRKLKFSLKCGQVVKLPSYLNLPRYGEFTRDYFNVANGDVKFSQEGVPANSQVTLVVEFPAAEKQKPLVAEFRFALDKYR